jgi:hypothetical protein
MAQHIVTDPGGTRHIIEAPDDATPEQVIAYARDNIPKPSQAESLGRGALQGVTFGFGDEIYGAAKGAYDKVFGSGDFSGTYERERDAVRRANANAEAANPGTYLAGEIGGGIAVPFGAAKVGVKGIQAADASLKARSLATATEGALYGGAFGLGKAEGDFADQAVAAASGAVTGGAVGGAIPGAVKLAGAAARVPGQMARVVSNPQAVATEKMAEAFARDAGKEIVPLQASAPITKAADNLASEAARGEKNLILADMGGENTKNLVRAANNMPNARAERFNQVLNRRQAVEGRRLGDVLEKSLAGGKEFTETLDEMIASRSANARPAFKEAYQAAIAKDSPADREISAFIDSRKYMGRLLEKTIENVRGVTGQNLEDLPPWEILHRVKMQINREIGAMKRGIQDGKASWDMNDLNTLNREFGGILAKHNPKLGGALRRFSDESGMINAVEDGADDFFKLSPEELAKKIKRMSADEADMYRVGATRAQIEKLRQGDVMRDRTKSLYGSDDIGLRLKAVFPEGPGRGEFMRTIAAARKMAATRRAAQGNSTTAKQLTQAQEAGKSIKTAADVAGAMSGKMGSVMNLLERGANFASGITPGVAAEILDLAMMNGAGRASAQSTRAIQDAFSRVQQRNALQGRVTNALVPAQAALSSETGQRSPAPLSGGIGPRFDEYGNRR